MSTGKPTFLEDMNTYKASLTVGKPIFTPEVIESERNRLKDFSLVHNPIYPHTYLSALNEITRLQAELKAANEDAQRLSEEWIEYGEYHNNCIHCGQGVFLGKCNHTPDCPYQLHLERIAKEGK